MSELSFYRSEYPRPQFVRQAWMNLNGEWDFAFGEDLTPEEVLPSFRKRKILVPYSYETPASLIHEEKEHDTVYYHKTFTRPSLGKNERFLLNFEGVDYLALVYLNGVFLGSHEGGYTRFSFDATDALKEGEQDLVVIVHDSFSTVQPRGKQRWMKDSFGCWYLQTTGIWKSVWGETVSSAHLVDVKMTPSWKDNALDFIAYFAGDVTSCSLNVKITFAGEAVAEVTYSSLHDGYRNRIDLRSNSFDFKVKEWTPSNPNLYEVEFTLKEGRKVLDHVMSYTGFRDIDWDKSGIRLNNVPLYQKLILDQGYWKKSGLTMPDIEAGRFDIDYLKKAGFNGVRIHQKIEDERFLYLCDTMGLLVWSEFPAEYEFNEKGISNFTREWLRAVRENYNHPSVIAWVPFNESWGIPNVFREKTQQEFVKGIVHLTKSLDPMRPVISNDGWEHVESDWITLHDYDGESTHMLPRYQNHLEKILNDEVAHGQYKLCFAKGISYQGQPVIVSEYGGISYGTAKGWGYTGATSEEDYLRRIEDLTLAIQSMDSPVVGYCYTQLTDVYQEVNGLLDMDHKPKVTAEKVKKINEGIRN